MRPEGDVGAARFGDLLRPLGPVKMVEKQECLHQGKYINGDGIFDEHMPSNRSIVARQCTVSLLALT